LEIKLGCGIIVRIHYLEAASKASKECRYSNEDSSEGNLLTVDRFTT